MRTLLFICIFLLSCKSLKDIPEIPHGIIIFDENMNPKVVFMNHDSIFVYENKKQLDEIDFENRLIFFNLKDTVVIYNGDTVFHSIDSINYNSFK